MSTHNGHIAELAAEITSSGTPVNLIILGGDGTVNEALQGIRDFSKVSIGFIPTGSGNDLARDMKLGKDPLKILDSILREDISRKVDLGKLTIKNETDASMKKGGANAPDSRFFVVSSGIGFDAAVCEEALSSRLKDTLNKLKLGKLTYLGIALKQLITAKDVSCDLYLDDKPPIHLKRFLFSAFMIHKYEGGGFKFCPDADAGDDCSIYVWSAICRNWSFFWLFPPLFRKALSFPADFSLSGRQDRNQNFRSSLDSYRRRSTL